MPTPTYTALATVTLGSATSSITFSSIPATYRDLILVMNGTTSALAAPRLRVNNDSGSNYSYVAMYSLSGGSPTSISGTGQTTMFPASDENTGGQQFSIGVQVMDYSATDKHKTVLFRDQEKNATVVGASAQRWANTAAVTQLNVFLNTSTYAAGSTFSLYGVIA